MRRVALLLNSLCTVGLLTSAGPARLAASEADAAAEVAALAPERAIVAGFERFHAAGEGDLLHGGMLLFAELNCGSCHAAPAAAALLSPKQAPLLAGIGDRVNPEFLRAYLADPHGTKPGTTMPSLLAHLDLKQRAATVEPLVHYLASLGSGPFKLAAPDGEAVGRGEALYHRVGCVACHAPQRGAPSELSRASVPLPKLEEKYAVASLTEFLSEPLRFRPSGRMPHMNLSPDEARDIAHYLLRDTDVPSNLAYSYYEGSWEKVPDFSRLEPKATGGISGFNLGPRRREANFGFKFAGFLEVAQEGEYKFWVTSDDGSLLKIDGKLVVDNDGIHAPQTREGKIKLAAGVHPIEVTYIQGGGEFALKVECEGPGIRRGTIPAGMLRATREPPPEPKTFTVDPAQADQGRALFSKVGCASCHQVEPDQPAAVSPGPQLAQLKTEGGCLSGSPAAGRPHYALSAQQVAALSAAMKAMQSGKPAAWTTQQRLAHTLVSLNCYACHERDGVGGVPRERDPYFTADDKDLGDEGRIPPRLTGIGDKLQDQWLAAVLSRAGTARPYMHARMPQFGQANVAHLTGLFIQEDRQDDQAPALTVGAAQAKEAGRVLVGKGGLSCIACHTFNRHKSLGIQATDLTSMPERLRRDWYHRYMLNPQRFRPGTRMPQAWPSGQTFKPEVLSGHVDDQILAVWEYLADGRKALRPEGLTRQTMELIVGGEAVIYRNFIQHAGPRAICVGHPEEVNLAFDAEAMRLAVLWQGRFIDASMHWTGRGQGFGKPLGTKVVNLPQGAPLAVLEDEKASWPKEVGKEAGYKFRGYRLDKLRRPTFMYEFQGITVEDYAEGRETSSLDFAPGGAEEKGKPARVLVRTLTFTASETVDNLYFRAAAQGKIEQLDATTFRLGEQLTIKLSGAQPPLLRDNNGPELLVPVVFENNQAAIVQEFHW